MFARAEGIVEPQLGDIIGLAVRLMHNTVFANTALAQDHEGSPLAH